ncbi:uncharacterized protein LOC128998880 [Macrosteles quadrilineatus]|uniref:uncharacterized protein LOC128998880 n=1 Tax=Macrosteles quadrilineatus TaxID=74068 RepID=UPI0023E33D0B|nr:uncharacterized protein LOC128998880 [Macrosteles quadrilineatus]
MSSEVDVDTDSLTKWLKIGHVSYMTFVGRDVVSFGAGCFILLYNTSTHEELLYTANSFENGEGVQCLVGYQQAYMFAFAETSPQPRIFLISYPSFEHICVLKDPMPSPHCYLTMAFAEMECLVCMTGIPTFEIIVWCWRTGVKLASLPTGINSSNIQLRCSVSMPIGVCLLAKMEDCSVFQLWQINICAKLCLLSKSDLSRGGLDSDTCLSAFCWSPEGTLMVADFNGSLYLVKEETQNFQKVFVWPYLSREGSCSFPTNVLWWKNGVVMSGPNGFIQFIKRVSSSEFQPGWCLTNQGPLLVMAVNRSRDILVGWSQNSSLAMVKVNDQNVSLEEMKHFGAPVRLVTLVHPTDKYLATVNTDNTLDICDITTGAKVSTLDINKGFVLDLQCNPELPYLTVARSDGVLQIVAVNNEQVFTLNELLLCSEEITGVSFNRSGTLIVAASYKVGRLFVIQGLVGTGNKINVLNHQLSNEPIINMHITTSSNPRGGEEHRLFVLTKHYPATDVGSPSGDTVVVYSLPRLAVENRVLLNTSYTSLVFNGQLFMAAPHVSRQIHFFNPIDLMEESDTTDGLKVVDIWESGHKIRRFDIGLDKNHVCTYGWDGLIFIRSCQAVDAKTPFCTLAPHNRFNQGVALATMDYCAKHVVSLGKEGNLVCSIVIKSCGHKTEDHMINTSNESYFLQKPTALIKSPTSSPSHPKTWLETQIHQKLNLEASAAAPEIENILSLFKEVQKEHTFP